LQRVSNDQHSHQSSPSGECVVVAIKTALLTAGNHPEALTAILIPENKNPYEQATTIPTTFTRRSIAVSHTDLVRTFGTPTSEHWSIVQQ